MTTGDALSAAGITVHVIEDEAAWDDVEPAWSRLFAASPYASTPLRFGWLRLWWSTYGPHYGRDGAGLRIVTAWDGARLLGVLPLYESASNHVRRLGFISTGEHQSEETCPDYMNFLCLRDEEGASLAACWRALRTTRWDHLDLMDIAEDSPLVKRGDLLTGAGHLDVSPRGACPIAGLQDGFESYLGTLSRNTRKVATRLLRLADAGHASLEFADPSNVDPFFDDLVRLHQHRWVARGEPGCFASPRFDAFHRALARAWVPTGAAVLARVSFDAVPVAVVYGFITGSKFDAYQSGMTTEPVGALTSPGALAHLMLMRELSTRGVAAYDFLRGSSFHKERLATDSRRLYRVQIWRSTVRARAARVAGSLRTAVRRARGLARGIPQR